MNIYMESKIMSFSYYNQTSLPVRQAGTPLRVTVRLSGNPIFIGHNVRMTESYINAVISTSARGEISLNKQTSPIVEVTAKGNCHW